MIEQNGAQSAFSNESVSCSGLKILFLPAANRLLECKGFPMTSCK